VVRRLGGYAAFDSSPPAIMFVAEPAKMIVAPQPVGIPVPSGVSALTLFAEGNGRHHSFMFNHEAA